MSEPARALDDTREAKTAWHCLEKAINRFNQSEDQRTLLQPRNAYAVNGPAASERAITHRLAFYLESELRKADLISDNSTLVVDCEYNRHGGELKELATVERLKGIVEKARNKKWDEADEDGFYVFSVAPDIVVHQRGTDARNRLVIELKKATNREPPEYDALKLELFTAPKDHARGYGNNLGAWLIAEDKCDPKNRKLRIAAKYERGISNT